MLNALIICIIYIVMKTGCYRHTVNMIDLDPREDFQHECLEPTEYLKEISIAPEPHQTTKIRTTLDPLEDAALMTLLKKKRRSICLATF